MPSHKEIARHSFSAIGETCPEVDAIMERATSSIKDITMRFRQELEVWIEQSLEYKEEIDTLQSKVAELEAEVSDLKTKITELESEVADRDTEIAALIEDSTA